MIGATEVPSKLFNQTGMNKLDRHRRPEYVYRVYDFLVRFWLWFPWGGYPWQRGEEIRPFFIVGSGRSGNTLLRRILCAHSELYIPPETYVLGRVIRLFRRYRRLPWSDLVHLILAQFQFHAQFETFEINLGSLTQSLLVLASKRRSLATILDQFYRFHARSKGVDCQRWGDKTPVNVFHLENIYQVFPQAHFIHMVRDGCDVAASYLQAGLYQDVAEAGKRWQLAVETAERFSRRHPEAFLEIRYESLVSAPQETMQQICDFLGIEYEVGMLKSVNHVLMMGDVSRLQHHQQVGQPISAVNIGKGRKTLTISQKQQLAHLINPTLNRLGYEIL